ncbi:unnamed protein product [Heligmosomoides polygyrus]|uniref:Helicase C-terminal domain-containing protein n=1 Tax=Heligmosomoides polygyrus TaxID=6339 RepID=A0A183F2U3_HELPZ|nr:unnamed protein product [Heligmosomoides polygyrus]
MFSWMTELNGMVGGCSFGEDGCEMMSERRTRAPTREDDVRSVVFITSASDADQLRAKMRDGSSASFSLKLCGTGLGERKRFDSMIA